jgi:hypothetical protein
MLNFLTKSLSVEIDAFISFVRKSIKGLQISCFSKSAFVQCRAKINPDVFKYLSEHLIKEFYTDNDASVQLWNGYRLLAVDGSCINLPDTRELADVYGRANNQTGIGVVQARFSALYDVLNKFVIDGSLSPLSISEGALALPHLAFSKKGDLIIYDRGYPSFDLIYNHFERDIDFLIRVKTSFSNVIKEFYQSDLDTDMVQLYPGRHIDLSEKSYSKDSFVQVRLVKVVLPTGEIEILITSLLEEDKYPNLLFKELYFLRWGIETFYDEIKNKLNIEVFSGYAAYSVLQDFYAMLFVSNVQSLMVGEINEELEKETAGKKYQYKVNTNLSYGFLKNRIISIFFSNKDTGTMVAELKELFKKHTVPIRPNRTFERNMQKYKKREKPKLLKNRKNAL